ncbi:MAG TPA: outer membrane protein assembly factor BamD [Candidatus Hydrogenedentes bacterium]|nr:outer membrane protein assembly factor BamD [Candidatus Hydrogenedentota bacterium]HRK35516.1 outer membrane protein assembly factor BamD [Candidatus Hydrogenedentota bacterium]
MRSMLRWVGAAIALTVMFQGAAEAQWTWSPQTGRWINMKRLPKETPELQVEYARSLLVQGDYKKALRETEKFQSYYNDTEWADDNQYVRGEIFLAQGDLLSSAKEFQQVVAAYPESDLFDQVIAKQYEIGDHFYDRGTANLEKGWWQPFRKRPFRRAITVYTMVIDNQPFTDSAAQAQYKVGLCHYTLEEYKEAAFEYQRVIDDYAASDFVDEASYGLAMCHYKDSLPPAYDQSPSLLAVEAIDNFNRKFPTDERNTELAGYRTEMVNRVAEQRLRTAKFYEKRRKFDSAAIYYEVVVEQFPNTPSAQEAEAWLQQHGHSKRWQAPS